MAASVVDIERICIGQDAYNIDLSSTPHKGRTVVFVSADRAHYNALRIPIPTRVPDAIRHEADKLFPNDKYIKNFEYDSIQPARTA